MKKTISIFLSLIWGTTIFPLGFRERIQRWNDFYKNYKDYYAVLNISNIATLQEISKKYRSLSRACHPDKNNGNPEAEMRFKEINEAYSILSNEEERDIYNEVYRVKNSADYDRSTSEFSSDESDDENNFFFSSGFGGSATMHEDTSSSENDSEDEDSYPRYRRPFYSYEDPRFSDDETDFDGFEKRKEPGLFGQGTFSRRLLAWGMWIGGGYVVYKIYKHYKNKREEENQKVKQEIFQKWQELFEEEE